MAQFSVIAADGRAYGPVNETGLIQWATEGRIHSATNVRCEPGGQIIPAGSLAFLAPALGRTAPGVANLPASISTPQPWMHTLSYFSVGLVVLLHFVTLGIFPMIWFGMMHDKMPKLRPDDPSAGKAIGFMFIPFFNIFWVFFSYLRLCDRVAEQRRLHGLPEQSLRGLALAACIIGVLPYINFLVGSFILWPIFFGKLQASVNELVAAPAPLDT